MCMKKGYASNVKGIKNEIIYFTVWDYDYYVLLFSHLFSYKPTYVPGVMPWKKDSVTQYLH